MTDIIFNADDFGLSAGVTRAIVQASRIGVVRSTTAMVCRGNDDIIRTLAPEMAGGIGLHLQLTDGKPLLPISKIRTLVGEDGRFPRGRKGIANTDPDEVRLEWKAQLDLLQSLGVRPTHIDSHHHVHMLENILPIYTEFARENGLPARSGPRFVFDALKAAGVDCPHVCVKGWSVGLTSSEQMVNAIRTAIRSNPDKVIEFVCHPGLADKESAGTSTQVSVWKRFLHWKKPVEPAAAPTWVSARELELQALCAPELVRALQSMGMTSVPMMAKAGTRDGAQLGGFAAKASSA